MKKIIAILTFGALTIASHAGNYFTGEKLLLNPSNEYKKEFKTNFLLNNLKSRNNSSFGAGVGLGLLKFRDFDSFIGVLGRFYYNKSEKIGFFGSLGYYFPKKDEHTSTAYASSSATSPSYIDVNVTDKLSIFVIDANLVYNFVGSSEDNFSLGGLLGAGFLMAGVKSEVGDYDASLYLGPESSSEHVSQLYINLGLSMEVAVSSVRLFAEPRFNIPANSANGEEIEVNLPANFGVNVGAKFPF